MFYGVKVTVIHNRDPFQPNPVLVLNGSNEYVEFNNHTNSGCINDLIGCQTGFTIKIAVNLIKLDHQYKTVILSNGNQFMNGTGLALYFYHGHRIGLKWIALQMCISMDSQVKGRCCQNVMAYCNKIKVVSLYTS
jgi:hypothetical protein